MKMHELCIKFLETRVRVNTNCGMYGAFLKKYFSPAIVGMDSKGSDITIDVLWEHGDWKQTLSREIDEGFLKIGANTYLSNETVATVLKDRQKIFFVWSKKHHEIHSKAVIRSRSLGRIFSGMFRAARQEECFYQITIQSIYYPLFYYFNTLPSKLDEVEI
jgi:hypothetical protein